jgi:hypothetical protein
MKRLDSRVADAQTVLVDSALEKICDYLESRQVRVDWRADGTTSRIFFNAKSGNQCEFRTKVEVIRPPGKPFVFFNYSKGDICETDFSGTPAAELTPEKILDYFKSIFEREL